MKDKLEFESMDLKGFVKQCPENATEYDQLAGRANAAVEDGLDYNLFHVVLTSFRKDFMSALIAETQIEPKRKDKVDSKGQTVKDSTGKVTQVLDEKPVDYLERVCAQLNRTPASFQALADKVCQGDGTKDYPGYDFGNFLKAAVRGPKTPPKSYVEVANTMLERGVDQVKRSLVKMTDLTKEAMPSDADIAKMSAEDIAWYIQRYQKVLLKASLVDA